MSIHGPHHPYHNPEPHRVSEAKRLSKLLWNARELCDMYGDIVSEPSMSHLTNHDQLGRNWAHRTRDEIDAYRAERGWSPNGFGGEMDSDLQADLVEAVAERDELLKRVKNLQQRIDAHARVCTSDPMTEDAIAAVITAWDESTSFQPCDECMKSGVTLWPYQSEEAVNDAIEALRRKVRTNGAEDRQDHAGEDRQQSDTSL